MTLPNRFDLVIRQGATLQVWFDVVFPDGSIADLPNVGDGYTIGRLQVRDKPRSLGGTVLLDLNTDNGGVVLGLMTDADGVQHSGYLYATAAATEALEPWGEGVHDFEVSDGANVHRLLEGVATLSLEATQ